MKKISSKENEIANTLNSKRDKAYIDIYRENDFNGSGILVDEELNIYKYEWKTTFSKETNGFSIQNDLYQDEKKFSYEEIETFLKDELHIIDYIYENDSNEDERSLEIIRLKNYEGEFQNIKLYDKIKEKIG